MSQEPLSLSHADSVRTASYLWFVITSRADNSFLPRGVSAKRHDPSTSGTRITPNHFRPMLPGRSFKRVRPLESVGPNNLHLPVIISPRANNRNPRSSLVLKSSSNAPKRTGLWDKTTSLHTSRYCGKPARRSRSLNLGSDRSVSHTGSSLR